MFRSRARFLQKYFVSVYRLVAAFGNPKTASAAALFGASCCANERDLERRCALSSERRARVYSRKICQEHYYSFFKEAIVKLNSLQSNAATVAKWRDNQRDFPQANLDETRAYLDALGINASLKANERAKQSIYANMQDAKLDALKPIHVSGTKGKGTTCAYAESILRALGIRTGLFT